MKKIAIIVLLAVISNFVYARQSRSSLVGPPKTKREFLQKIKGLQEQIDKLKKIIKAQRQKTENLEIENEKLRSLCEKAGVDSTQIMPGIAAKFKKPLKIGQAAYLGGDNSLRAEQIIDSRNMIAKLTFGYYREIDQSAARNPGFLTSIPYTGPYIPIDTFVWLKDIDTSGVVDGQKIKIDGALKVTGTKTYKTMLGGTSTVFVLEPVNNAKPKK